MSEPLRCTNPACMHDDSDHDDTTGMCNLCRCLYFRAEDDWDDEDGPEELFLGGDAA